MLLLAGSRGGDGSSSSSGCSDSGGNRGCGVVVPGSGSNGAPAHRSRSSGALYLKKCCNPSM